jgi:hypothetical protein
MTLPLGCSDATKIEYRYRYSVGFDRDVIIHAKVDCKGLLGECEPESLCLWPYCEQGKTHRYGTDYHCGIGKPRYPVPTTIGTVQYTMYQGRAESISINCADGGTWWPEDMYYNENRP